MHRCDRLVATLVAVTSAFFATMNAAPQADGTDSGQHDYVYGVLSETFAYFTSSASQRDPPALRSRVAKVYADVLADRYALRFTAAPQRPDEVALFTAGFEPNGTPRITAHVPELRAWDVALRQREPVVPSNRPRSLVDVVGVSIAHERMHFEICRHGHSHRHTPQELAVEEANAWGMTIDQIVWPLAKAGRVPYPNVLDRAELLWKRFGGKYDARGWISSFTPDESSATGQTWPALVLPSAQ